MGPPGLPGHSAGHATTPVGFVVRRQSRQPTLMLPHLHSIACMHGVLLVVWHITKGGTRPQQQAVLHEPWHEPWHGGGS